MKKQNGMNKMAFNKSVVVELNDGQLNDVNGGSWVVTIIISL
ncbi:class I lanthipeptide, partial [Flavobacterium sp.]